MANAATIPLDPGPGTDYLGIWCGGQQVNEIATGFDALGYATTLVKVTTTCHGSGRGSPNQYYLACWTVGFGPDGSIQSKTWLATNHWGQGNPAIPCPVSADPAAVYDHLDGAGNFPAALSTSVTNNVDRAVLDATCAPIIRGDALSGTIGATGEETCYGTSGTTGDQIRVTVTETAGALVPVAEVRRPDGTALCRTTAGVATCTLDVSGAHTIVVSDASGTATGDYQLTLACPTPSCGPGAPHLTIGMTAKLTSSRFARTLIYTIAVGNDGDAPADDVVLDDTLPSGLFVKSVSTAQGTCAQTKQAVSCAIGSIAPSQSVAVVISAITALSSAQVTNTACVDTNTCISTTTEIDR
jgi:uncharacterized repeat protein (TIGR01451 family)